MRRIMWAVSMESHSGFCWPQQPQTSANLHTVRKVSSLGWVSLVGNNIEELEFPPPILFLSIPWAVCLMDQESVCTTQAHKLTR